MGEGSRLGVGPLIPGRAIDPSEAAGKDGLEDSPEADAPSGPRKHSWPSKRSCAIMDAWLEPAPAAALGRTRVAEPLDFEGFFEENRARLFGALCLVTGNRHEAEEITQDAFIRLWERWPRVSTLEDPIGFLFRTAMNVFRSRARRAKLGLRRAVALASPTDDLAAVEDRDEMVRVMRRLTPHQRAALVLTGYLGYTSKEAASILGIRASTVRALATQGRATARAEGQR